MRLQVLAPPSFPAPPPARPSRIASSSPSSQGGDANHAHSQHLTHHQICAMGCRWWYVGSPAMSFLRQLLVHSRFARACDSYSAGGSIQLRGSSFVLQTPPAPIPCCSRMGDDHQKGSGSVRLCRRLVGTSRTRCSPMGNFMLACPVQRPPMALRLRVALMKYR